MKEQDKDSRQPGWETQGESLNTSSAAGAQQQTDQQEQPHQKGGIHNNALYAASMGRPATAQVDPHNNAGLTQTGTNTSYEGPVAAGAGGSAGTGYTSGQAGTGATIATDSDFDQARVTTSNKPGESPAADDTVADENY